MAEAERLREFIVHTRYNGSEGVTHEGPRATFYDVTVKLALHEHLNITGVTGDKSSL